MGVAGKTEEQFFFFLISTVSFFFFSQVYIKLSQGEVQRLTEGSQHVTTEIQALLPSIITE